MNRAKQSITIEINSKPSSAELCHFWSRLKNDDTLTGIFMDTMPAYLEDFLLPIAKDEMAIWTITVNGELAGVHWMHDIRTCQESRSGWLATYYFKEYRRKLRTIAAKKVIQAAQSTGIEHVFTGIRTTNKPTLVFGYAIGFHLIGTIERFGWFDGELGDLYVLTIEPSDGEEAMRHGYERAQYYRLHPPVTAGPKKRSQLSIAAS